MIDVLPLTQEMLDDIIVMDGMHTWFVESVTAAFGIPPDEINDDYEYNGEGVA